MRYEKALIKEWLSRIPAGSWSTWTVTHTVNTITCNRWMNQMQTNENHNKKWLVIDHWCWDHQIIIIKEIILYAAIIDESSLWGGYYILWVDFLNGHVNIYNLSNQRVLRLHIRWSESNLTTTISVQQIVHSVLIFSLLHTKITCHLHPWSVSMNTSMLPIWYHSWQIEKRTIWSSILRDITTNSLQNTSVHNK